MRLVRFGPAEQERPGVWLEDALGPGRPGILDVRAMAFDLIDFNRDFFERDGLRRLKGLFAETRREVVDAAGVRLGPPLARPRLILCMGKNYAAHAKEFGGPMPEAPVLFSKSPGAWSGPFDPIRLAPRTRVADGEAELAVVIGRRARRVREDEALEYVAGYLVLNDVTDREAQRAGQQWFFGKSFDSFCPAGPFFVTADEVADPHRLRVFSRLNGAPLQDGNTADMMYRLPAILAWATSGLTLEPGDVIATGTPDGIGSARNPPRLLQPGDVLETGVEGLGTQRARVERDA